MLAPGQPAGRITVYYAAPSPLPIEGFFGHIFVSVENYATGDTWDLDVASRDGMPFLSPLAMRDTEELRREEHDARSWDLSPSELRAALDQIEFFYENPQDYALLAAPTIGVDPGYSCVRATALVIDAAGWSVDSVTPEGLWHEVQEVSDELVNYEHYTCEAHDTPPQESRDWSIAADVPDYDAAAHGDSLWCVDEDGSSDAEHDASSWSTDEDDFNDNEHHRP